MKGRIIGREGRNIRALEQATGVDLIIDDTPETVVLSGLRPGPPRDRPVGAHQAHRATAASTRAGSRRSSPRPAPRSTSSSARPANRPPTTPAFRACRPRSSSCSAGSSTARATARTCSSTRSRRATWRRSSPPRLGADVQIAKMGGLLHDIGKAVDHEVEGPHAAIGAAIAPEARPAVQGRQRDRRAPPGGRVRLPRGADRPGRGRDLAPRARAPAARRWTRTSSASRISRRIAESFTGVEQSFAVQAGREVRILVRPEEIDDLTASGWLATSSRRSRSS